VTHKFAFAVFILAVGLFAFAAGPQPCSVTAVFSSPEADGLAETALVAVLDEAMESLDIALYSFTDDQVGAAVLRAFRRGVAVRVLLDEGQKRARGGEYLNLISMGVPVVLVRGSGLFHHKFAVIDGAVVITGSYNWTASADERNWENLVFIRCPQMAGVFEEEFERIWLRNATP